MNKYVTSLELSKELYEKGIVTDSEWWWVLESGDWVLYHKNSLIGTHNEHYPAYIAEELSEILLRRETSIAYVDGKYEIYYESSKGIDYDHCLYDTKLSDALAKMILWLKKEGYLNV